MLTAKLSRFTNQKKYKHLNITKENDNKRRTCSLNKNNL